MTGALEFDVVVAGGGSAGVAAAVAAASNGANTALIENHGFLGGKATTAYVGTVCGLYLRNEENQLRHASGGFARTFEERLRSKSKSEPRCHKNGLWYLPYQPFDFLRVCDGLVTENKVKLFLHTVLCDVQKTDGYISGVRAIAYDREVFFKCKAVIDCTGEAMVSKLSGLPVIECDEYQQSAQVFTMDGLAETETSILNLLLIREIKRGIETGKLDAGLSGISIVPGSHSGSTVSLKVAIPIKISNDLNKITPVEMLARILIETIATFLTDYVAPFRNARISQMAAEAGIRTGRRPVGKKELDEKAVLGCEKTPDGIANGAWPIESWNLGKNVNMQYFAVDNYYQIPAGCLQSAHIPNLYFAGRHISATNLAIASARVIGTCLSTGYAAGKLASDLLKGIKYDDSIAQIRKQQVEI